MTQARSFPRQRPYQGIRPYHGIAVAADSVVTANGDVAARSMGSRGRSRRRCAGVVRQPDGATISAGMAARSSHCGRRRRPRATVGVLRRPGQQERRGRAEVAGDDGLLFGDRSVELLADRDQRLGVSSGGRTGCRPGTGPANAPRPTSSSRPDVRQRPDRGVFRRWYPGFTPPGAARWSPRHETDPERCEARTSASPASERTHWFSMPKIDGAARRGRIAGARGWMTSRTSERSPGSTALSRCSRVLRSGQTRRGTGVRWRTEAPV